MSLGLLWWLGGPRSFRSVSFLVEKLKLQFCMQKEIHAQKCPCPSVPPCRRCLALPKEKTASQRENWPLQLLLGYESQLCTYYFSLTRLCALLILCIISNNFLPSQCDWAHGNQINDHLLLQLQTVELGLISAGSAAKRWDRTMDCLCVWCARTVRARFFLHAMPISILFLFHLFLHNPNCFQ